jgi:GNAT superfamily N-acetyltransferase
VTVRIRAAQPGEERQVLAMYAWLFEPPGRFPPGWDADAAIARITAAIASADSAVLIAEDLSPSLVGLCAAYLDLDSVRFGRRCWVEDLAVSPERRSEGIGARLLAAACDWARERGASHLELDTSESRTAARRFYEREAPDHVGISYSWELR